MLNWLKIKPGKGTPETFFYLRVDDRLIHGQVVIGWGVGLDVNRLVLADDRLAASAAEREFYRQIIPETMGGTVVSLAEALELTGELRQPGRRAIVVVGRVEDAMRWVETGQHPDLLILGGLHSREGRERLTDYLYLTPQEIEQLREAAGRGVRVVCRDLPTSEGIDFLAALGQRPR
ncbi:MAG: PTS mannose/fructose/sorbose transporter subunit IIB [Candidatus Zixiibacteriota bacterium]|nr:MAG: PTS mannose/fructose/sorbose transporter subunit IIB [candidate division Zixibacteria bacterium]